jgi:hypothetical protein
MQPMARAKGRRGNGEAPERGDSAWSIFLSPRSGALPYLRKSHGLRRGLHSFALRAFEKCAHVARPSGPTQVSPGLSSLAAAQKILPERSRDREGAVASVRPIPRTGIRAASCVLKERHRIQPLPDGRGSAPRIFPPSAPSRECPSAAACLVADSRSPAQSRERREPSMRISTAPSRSRLRSGSIF